MSLKLLGASPAGLRRGRRSGRGILEATKHFAELGLGDRSAGEEMTGDISSVNRSAATPERDGPLRIWCAWPSSRMSASPQAARCSPEVTAVTVRPSPD
jgi:hypothetical protein